jgi:hypothetical protein
MKVRELIEKLQDFDPEAEVQGQDFEQDCRYELDNVSWVEKDPWQGPEGVLIS